MSNSSITRYIMSQASKGNLITLTPKKNIKCVDEKYVLNIQSFIKSDIDTSNLSVYNKVIDYVDNIELEDAELSQYIREVSMTNRFLTDVIVQHCKDKKSDIERLDIAFISCEYSPVYDELILHVNGPRIVPADRIVNIERIRVFDIGALDTANVITAAFDELLLSVVEYDKPNDVNY